MLVNLLMMNVIIASLIIMLAYFICFKSTKDQEKMSPFECGFLPQLNSRSPFSMQFFLISLIFLIFDVELILIFPFILKVLFLKEIYSFLVIWVFLFILSIGLFIEWYQKMLEWYK